MTTAAEIITGAFGKAAIFQPEDTILAEDTVVALACLNDYLNNLNARGAVFPSVSLAVGDSVPIGAEHVRDLKWALAGEIASQWGKTLQAKDLGDTMQADRRFVLAHTRIPSPGADAGLGSMPSRRRF